MSARYNFAEIEPRWQKEWEQQNLFETRSDRGIPKYYCLEMYPYPSGNLHMGHVRVYTIGDAIARFKRMNGLNVLHPMGWDAFGLPAENAAVEHGIHPAAWTWKNIATMKETMKRLGISYDWDREVATCSPDYYKWTQWLFLLMYKRGLAYKKEAEVNWCPSCVTVLANEQVEAGRCWRCENEVIRKDLEQWFFRITSYADRLLQDLDLLGNWPERVRIMQRNWIGRSHGVEIDFPVEGIRDEKIRVFTTRGDTVFGVTYMVLAPEHPLVTRLVEGTPREEEVLDFARRMSLVSEVDRIETEKIGLDTGAFCINPFNGERVPILVGNYVLMEYGTGAVMGVPAHDQRDFEFARKYGLPIRIVVQDPENPVKLEDMAAANEEYGIMVNSGPFDGLPSREGQQKVAEWLEERGLGGPRVNYRLRDWLISRQRYWGAPIPIIYCDKCGTVPVPEEDLPVILPENVVFEPGGASPLARSEEFVNTTCPSCEGPARRETDTMDTFICSSWYFLRYVSPKADGVPFEKDEADYWMPVDQYVGGIEHAVLHLLYSRFFTKVLHDAGWVKVLEPFTNLLAQGMVIKDGAKMSKSKGNVVTPEEIIGNYGADTTRLFILFAAPPEKDLEWSDQGVEGCSRFLGRLWRLIDGYLDLIRDIGREDPGYHFGPAEKELRRQVHLTIQKVTEDIGQRFNFNTAISAIMELVNAAYAYREAVPADDQNLPLVREALETMLLLLCPFAPHITEELWHMLGHEESIHLQTWPRAEQEALVTEQVTVVVQVNGRVRDRVLVPVNASDEELKSLALAQDRIQQFVGGKEIVKIVTVPQKLINVVVR